MKTLDTFYQELLKSDALQSAMLEATLGGRLEAFFREHGCGADEDEIWNYFRRQLLRSGELSEAELQSISGGSVDLQTRARMFALCFSAKKLS